MVAMFLLRTLSTICQSPCMIAGWSAYAHSAKCHSQSNSKQRQNNFVPLHIKLGLMKQFVKLYLCMVNVFSIFDASFLV